MPTANAEGLVRIGWRHRKGLGDTRLQAPSDRHGSSALAVGMLRDIKEKKRARRDSRADHKLPEGATLLACFNQLYKIDPPTFDVWVDLVGD